MNKLKFKIGLTRMSQAYFNYIVCYPLLIFKHIFQKPYLRNNKKPDK